MKLAMQSKQLSLLSPLARGSSFSLESVMSAGTACKRERKRRKQMKAAHDTAIGLGVVIEEVESTGRRGDRVAWRWSNERKLHRSWTREIRGKTCFRVNRQWIPLDECKSTDNARATEDCSR